MASVDITGDKTVSISPIENGIRITYKEEHAKQVAHWFHLMAVLINPTIQSEYSKEAEHHGKRKSNR